VIEYRPAQPRTFADVQAQIVQKLTMDKAIELARQDGEAKLARLRKGETADVAWSTGVMAFTPKCSRPATTSRPTWQSGSAN